MQYQKHGQNQMQPHNMIYHTIRSFKRHDITKKADV